MADITFIYVQQAIAKREKISDTLLESYLKGANQLFKYPFSFILNKVIVQENTPVQETYNYAYELFDRIVKMMGYNYTENDIKIFATYFVIKATNLYSLPVNTELINLCKEIIELEPSQEIFEKIKEEIKFSYIILHTADVTNYSNGVIDSLLAEINPDGLLEVELDNILFKGINE